MKYKNWVVVSILLFLAGIALGMFNPESLSALLASDVAALQELSRTLTALPPIATAMLIFAKNASALLASFAFSPILLLVPILALTSNGLLLGWVSATVVKQESVLLLLAGILPHGIIELPAFVIGEAAALGFGALVILSVFKKEIRSQVLPGFKNYVKYLLLALALLFPAAFIEAFITPLLVRGA